jgi:hypothetical protein
MYSMFNPSLPIKGKLNLNPATLLVTQFFKNVEQKILHDLLFSNQINLFPKDFVTLQIYILSCMHFLKMYELYFTFFCNSKVTYAKFLNTYSTL